MNARSLMTSALALAAAATPLAAQTGVTSTSKAPQVSEFTVAGIPVVFKPISANDVIAVRLYLKGGSAALTPATQGIERLMAMVGGRGTEKYNGDTVATRLTSTGTRLGFEVEYDYTVFTAQGVKQSWNDVWDLFTQTTLHATFPENEVEQTRGRLLNALKQRTDDPDAHLEMIADSLMYVGHPYSLDPGGTTEAIAKISREDLLQWRKQRMTKANLLIVVVGNVTREDLTAKIKSAFGSLPTTGGTPAKLAAVPTLQPDLVVVKQDLPTNYVMGVFSAPSPASPDFAAMRVASRVLSERLFEEVRTKRNLTYAVSSGIATRSANRGNLYVTAVDPDTAVKVILSEVKRLQSEPVDVERLKQTINVFATGMLMSQQTNMGQAASLGLWEVSGGGWENAVSYVDRLRKVTPAEIQSAATKYMRNTRFVVIGDPAKIDRRTFIAM